MAYLCDKPPDSLCHRVLCTGETNIEKAVRTKHTHTNIGTALALEIYLSHYQAKITIAMMSKMIPVMQNKKSSDLQIFFFAAAYDLEVAFH